jgi:sulfite exporter TauE/SafE
MFYLSAWIVGFLGSFHCAGMCGPLAMALPVNRDKPASVFAGRLLYNAGRITTYMLLGMVAGLLGHTLAMAGFQKTLSIASGVLILVVAGGVVVSFEDFFSQYMDGKTNRRHPKTL